MRAVQTAIMNQCEAMKDRVAILALRPHEPAADPRVADETDGTTPNTPRCTTPVVPASPIRWAKRTDPGPPSGHMAGIWERSDGERVCTRHGQAVVRGALGLEVQISRNEQDTLNPIGVNCVAPSLARHSRVGCAHPVERSSWRYLNVRRRSTSSRSPSTRHQWVVFEPNDLDWGARQAQHHLVPDPVWSDGALLCARRPKRSSSSATRS